MNVIFSIDLAGIAIFALAWYGILVIFLTATFDEKIWWVALYPSLFFIGTTLYVKSMMRERKNPLYLKASIIFHVLCVLGCLFTQQLCLIACFCAGVNSCHLFAHQETFG